ncbi:ATP synthase F1 subunit epsilon [Sporomusa acidovorans]|uniref:ATP synthase epsilon chain n=1 Tax=Sporomusa acidovorans (strain ATCC 49682 / DSM 3132 / Mol) TaxID=1123286 RepID=A0ABZ3JA12_SPOA4|nr:ATP synthase F1 subunit epsilon [Sporomusa acidovorans]OZC16056.1 ATP synthase epsilon chain [Sporomusa acidovorans DSM 3132]SDD88154.1 ATP synthase, F1 epsilon subunit [Sporomusa acidovorans]
MNKTLHVKIVNPQRKIYEGDVRMIIARATTGELGVLPGHAPMFALLDPWPVRLLTEEGERQIDIQGGILQVKPDSVVTIITNGEEKK